MTPETVQDVSPAPIGRHNEEIQRNRLAWARKPQLRAAYRGFHEQIALRIDRRIPGQIVELGSGMGSIKEVIPDCVTTDLFPNPWLDRQENAYRLNFADGSVSHLILFDVWHHLRYPATALREFRRVLAPKGRLILFEPAMSWTGRLVYGLFHNEPLGMGHAATWDAPAGFKPDDADYYAAQGAATRMFWRLEQPDRLGDWTLGEATPLPSFEYFATGGFSGPQVGGRHFLEFWRWFDRFAAPWPNLFAARLIVVLIRSGTQP